MRADGVVVYYVIEHQDRNGWHESDLAHFLFHGLTQRDKNDSVGDYYRSLIAPQNASSPLWQKYGIHGFEKISDAGKCIDAIARRHPTRPFRLVRRTKVRRSEIIRFGNAN